MPPEACGNSLVFCKICKRWSWWYGRVRIWWCRWWRKYAKSRLSQIWCGCVCGVHVSNQTAEVFLKDGSQYSVDFCLAWALIGEWTSRILWSMNASPFQVLNEFLEKHFLWHELQPTGPVIYVGNSTGTTKNSTFPWPVVITHQATRLESNCSLSAARIALVKSQIHRKPCGRAQWDDEMMICLTPLLKGRF